MMIQTIISTIVTVIVTAIITGAITYAKTTHTNSKSIKEGMLSLLRLMIIQQHSNYMSEEYCSINDKEVIEKAYKAYHDLGGNGAITIYYTQIMALPTRKDK